MKIEIGCTQRFDVTVTAPLIAALTKLGTAHYDSVCKAAVMHGGFIFGWRNRMGFLQEGGRTTFVESITNQQLQTCLKICEFPPPTLSQEESIARNHFFQLGFAALQQAEKDPRFAMTVPVNTNARDPALSIALTYSELRELLASPEALDVLIDWHDHQQSQADAMDAPEPAKHHEKRRKELKALREQAKARREAEQS